MGEQKSSKSTGISGITGKVVQVRHANEGDMVFIKDSLKRHHWDTLDVDNARFVVAVENGDLLGFGGLTLTGEAGEINCIVVMEEKRKKGIGALIVEHLIEHAPVEKLYTLTDAAEYFRALGFAETKEGPQDLLNSLAAACKVPGRESTVLMVRRKSRG